MITVKQPKPALRLYDNDLLFWNHEGKEYCLHVRQDDMPESPRGDYEENLATMACFHRRYQLGDQTGYKDAGKFWRHIVEEFVPKDGLLKRLKAGDIAGYKYEPLKGETGEPSDQDLMDDFLEQVEDENIGIAINACQGHVAILPLWLYDHSGITMSCGERTYPYNDRWDSGCVGWILMDKAKAIKELSVPVKNPDGTQAMDTGPDGREHPKFASCDDGTWEQAAIRCMTAEVTRYDQYLTDDVYFYTLYERDAGDKAEMEEWTELDTVSGFYGAEIEKNGILDNVGYGIVEAIAEKAYTLGKAESYTVVHWRFKKN